MRLVPHVLFVRVRHPRLQESHLRRVPHVLGLLLREGHPRLREGHMRLVPHVWGPGGASRQLLAGPGRQQRR